MEKISDEFLEYKIALLQKSGCEAISISSDVLLPILQELKERREADEISTDKVRDCKKMCRNCALTEISGDDFDKCIIDGHTIKNYSDGCKKWEPDNDTLIELQTAEIIQLKQRKKAESTGKKSLSVEPLDIKGQLRLVRDKCPGMWDLIVTSLYACPSMIDTGLQPNLLDSKDICYGFGNDNCKECWDKALGGDE